MSFVERQTHTHSHHCAHRVRIDVTNSPSIKFIRIFCLKYSSFQLHLGVESIRAPELLFQPSMIGSSEAGIVETIDFVLKQFSSEEQLLLAQNIFLAGGCANLKGINRIVLFVFNLFLFFNTQIVCRFSKHRVKGTPES